MFYSVERYNIAQWDNIIPYNTIFCFEISRFRV